MYEAHAAQPAVANGQVGFAKRNPTDRVGLPRRGLSGYAFGQPDLQARRMSLVRNQQEKCEHFSRVPPRTFRS